MASVQPVAQGYQYYPPIKSVKEFPDHYEYTFKEEASTGKKWGVGIGSFIIPGLGQAINGQWGKAAGMFDGFGVVNYFAKKSAKDLKINFPALIAGWALAIFSSYDAVKNSGSEFKQSFPKEQVLNAQA